jgi:hypothetical protein
MVMMFNNKCFAFPFALIIISLSLPAITTGNQYELLPIKEATLLGIGGVLNITQLMSWPVLL